MRPKNGVSPFTGVSLITGVSPLTGVNPNLFVDESPVATTNHVIERPSTSFRIHVGNGKTERSPEAR